jgi:hypothetical protein
MATSKTCDICGGEAVSTVEAKSDKTTPIKVDVCQDHLELYKKLMRILLETDGEPTTV